MLQSITSSKKAKKANTRHVGSKPNLKNIQIKGVSGFENFIGVQKTTHDRYIHIQFNSTELKCAVDHRILTDHGWKFAYEVSEGDKSGEHVVTAVNYVEDTIDLYDIIESDSNTYISNGIVSHNCYFISSSGTLVNSRFLEALPSKEPVKEVGDLRLFVDNLRGRKIAVSLDPSEGVGEDYSCIQLFDFIEFEQVGEYRNNMVNQTQLAVHLREIIKMLYREGVDEVMFSYEANGIGAGIGVLLESLSDDPDFANVQVINDPSREAKGRTGMMTTNKTKLEACGKFKDLVENEKITLHSQRLLNELKTFVKKGSSFEAEPGNNDDLVSGCLLFVRMLDELRNYEEKVDSVVSSVSLDNEADEVYDIFF